MRSDIELQELERFRRTDRRYSRMSVEELRVAREEEIQRAVEREATRQRQRDQARQEEPAPAAAAPGPGISAQRQGNDGSDGVSKGFRMPSPHRLTLDRAKELVTVFDLWRHYRLAGEPRRSCHCPLHDDKHESFSIKPDGQLWNCHGECKCGGDQITFIEKIEHCSRAEAIEKFLSLAGETSTIVGSTNRPPSQSPTAKSAITFTKTSRATPPIVLPA